MNNYTREDILRLVEEEDVEFIRLQFTDIFGTMKNVAVTTSQLEKALNNKCMFDGSSIEGFARIEQSDMYLYPDLNTFEIFPWRPQQGKVARMICDVHRPDGTPFDSDPRYVLKRVLDDARSDGYEFNVGPECEFFLFETDEDGQPTTKTHENASYFDLGPLDFGENARRDMVLTLEDMGFEIEASHHEAAPGQHEIVFRYDEGLATADNIMTFKLVVKTIAKRHGLHATFMPKPMNDSDGCGMHLKMTLMDLEGNNILSDPADSYGLSELGYHFMAGIMAHVRGLTAVTNPLVNSYKRIVPGNEAPAYIVWSSGNRSPLISVPRTSAKDMHIELRNPDPCVNSYLAFAGIIAAGLEGIKKGLMPQAATELNIYRLSEEECEKLNLKRLPKSLSEAVEEMEKDPLVMKTLGEYISGKYVRAKRREVSQYQAYVTDWETGQYLNKY